MKIKTTDAARRLHLHPARIFQHVVELAPDLAFTDVWPHIDEEWIETVGALERRGAAPPEAQRSPAPPTGTGKPTGQRLSAHAVRVLDKLSRQRKWGHVSVAFDALQNLTHIPKRDLADALGELRKGGFLDHDGAGRGTISLNSAKRDEVEAITQEPHASAPAAAP